MENFVTDLPDKFKTPAMTVSVYNENEHIIDTFSAPPGFQLERFVFSLFPTFTLALNVEYNPDGKKCFIVKVLKENILVYSYNGVYE